MSLGSLCFGFLSSPGLLSAEKLDFVISTPLSNRSCLCAAPGEQDGATWAEKSHPNGPKWPRRGKSEESGQSSLAGRFGLAVNVMELTGNQPKVKSSQVKA